MRLPGAAPVCRVLRRLSQLALLTTLASCSSTSMPSWSFADIMPKSGAGAIAKLLPKNGSSVGGTVTFVQRGDKIVVAAVVHELTPGPHSMYIHEVGNCSSPNAASAGKVWALVGAAPGRTRSGNLPEIVAGSQGNASVVADLRGITLGDGSPLDIIGHAVVVHSGVDLDPRPEFGVLNGWLACGVIQRQQPDKAWGF
ncbi:MAG TPA: superoxide dismutase family protein [Casimicrobiaceae bacterium]|nr:superoxide dismutase family protein [Casimicrobiaceae bacterium]